MQQIRRAVPRPVFFFFQTRQFPDLRGFQWPSWRLTCRIWNNINQLAADLLRCSSRLSCKIRRHANDLAGAYRMHFAPMIPVKEVSQRGITLCLSSTLLPAPLHQYPAVLHWDRLAVVVVITWLTGRRVAASRVLMWPQVLVLMAEGLCCSPGRCTWSWQVLVAVITLPVEWLRGEFLSWVVQNWSTGELVLSTCNVIPCWILMAILRSNKVPGNLDYPFLNQNNERQPLIVD